MSAHIDRTHLIASIRSIDRRRALIAKCALDEVDIRILTMRHIEHKPFGYIADIIGLSVSQVGKRYKRALEALAEVARE